MKRELAAANVLAEQGMDPAEIQYERAFENNTESESFERYRVAVLLPAEATGED